jgi:hypothetical protein
MILEFALLTFLLVTTLLAIGEIYHERDWPRATGKYFLFFAAVFFVHGSLTHWALLGNLARGLAAALSRSR